MVLDIILFGLNCQKEQNLQVLLRCFSHALDPFGFRVWQSICKSGDGFVKVENVPLVATMMMTVSANTRHCCRTMSLTLIPYYLDLPNLNFDNLEVELKFSWSPFSLFPLSISLSPFFSLLVFDSIGWVGIQFSSSMLFSK